MHILDFVELFLKGFRQGLFVKALLWWFLTGDTMYALGANESR
jgi:hypothetical protein